MSNPWNPTMRTYQSGVCWSRYRIQTGPAPLDTSWSVSGGSRSPLSSASYWDQTFSQRMNPATHNKGHIILMEKMSLEIHWLTFYLWHIMDKCILIFEKMKIRKPYILCRSNLSNVFTITEESTWSIVFPWKNFNKV